MTASRLLGVGLVLALGLAPLPLARGQDKAAGGDKMQKLAKDVAAAQGKPVSGKTGWRCCSAAGAMTP
jgi:hypothetical protein